VSWHVNNRYDFVICCTYQSVRTECRLTSGYGCTADPFIHIIVLQARKKTVDILETLQRRFICLLLIHRKLR